MAVKYCCLGLEPSIRNAWLVVFITDLGFQLLKEKLWDEEFSLIHVA